MKKKEFEKLNKIDQRKLVAGDVLKRLKINFMPITGSYINIAGLSHYTTWDSDEAQAYAITETCHVCAKGAIVMSFIAMFNNYSGNDISEVVLSGADDEGDNFITEVFGKVLWSEIEMAYEGWDSNDDEERGIGKFVNLEDGEFTWKDGFSSPTARLENMMLEISETGSMNVNEPYEIK